MTNKLEHKYDFMDFWLTLNIANIFMLFLDAPIEVTLLIPSINIIFLAPILWKLYFYKKWFSYTATLIHYDMKKIKITGKERIPTLYLQTYCKYKYNINNKDFINDKLSMFNLDYKFNESDWKKANKLIYPKTVGDNITIYINPKNFQESVVFNYPSKLYSFYIYGVLFLTSVPFLIFIYKLSTNLKASL